MDSIILKQVRNGHLDNFLQRSNMPQLSFNRKNSSTSLNFDTIFDDFRLQRSWSKIIKLMLILKHILPVANREIREIWGP